MPYIKQEDRNKFNEHLTEAIKSILKEPSDARKADMIGWWTYYITHRIISTEVSTKKDPEQIKELRNHADLILNKLLENFNFTNIQEKSLFALAGNLNYCISYVLWGVLGDYPESKPASYGMRAYCSQQIRQVVNSESLDFNQRLFVIIKAVIFDVLEEVYRRKTSVYEDKKIEENGDLVYGPISSN